ncbi:MAG: exosortase U, partial [Methylococcaceae bacterium]|nr:exosortase U [Methylococcaceae bacterium]
MTTWLGLLFALGYAPLLTLFFINLWSRPHYQFFPLALVGAGFLAWTRLAEVPRPFEPGRPLFAKLLLAIAFFCLALATVLWSPWLGSIAAWIGLAGAVWGMGGKPLLRAMLPALLLVLTIIPLPLTGDTRLIQQLRVMAVTLSSRLLDVLGVTHALSGNIIELQGQKLLVDEACSGINSALITLAGCLFYGMWQRRSAIHILICLANTLAFVLLGNLARITLGAWLRFNYNIDVLSGRAHELTGLVLFLSYLVMIVSMDQLLVGLTSPSRRRMRSARSAADLTSESVPESIAESPAAVQVEEQRPPPGRISQSWARAAGYSSALLGVAGLGFGWLNHRRVGSQSSLPISALRPGATFAMPEQIGQWKRLNTEIPELQKVETMGVSSQVWHYRRGDALASLALDYPFHGYHDVRVCYGLRGWDMVEQRSRGGQGTNASPPFEEVTKQNQLDLHGALWFSMVDERGQWLAMRPLKPRLRTSFLDRLKTDPANESVTYRIQVLSTGFNSLKPVLEKYPNNPGFRQTRGEILVRLGRWQEAV